MTHSRTWRMPQGCQNRQIHPSAGLDAKGKPRALSAVAWSMQRYLIFAILSCVPDRQRTLRELRVGKTLVKEGDTCVHDPMNTRACILRP